VPAPPRRVVVSHKEIGQRIKLLRQERGWTQVELGKRLEITQPNLSAIERGSRGVTVHQVVKIAKALGASTDEILVAEKAPQAGQRPKKRLMQRLLKVQELGERDQRLVLQLLDGLMMGHREKMERQAEKRAKADSRVA
jgi:transcriptional regulator with XRE-family HTH domain